MDTTQLQKVYSEKLPENVQSHIDELESVGLDIKLMPNFSKDIEQSLSQGTNIYKGMQVEIPLNYKLTSKDKMWFHPDLLRSRSIHKASTFDASKLEKFSAVVGSYYKNVVTDLGDIRQEKYVIVDTGIQDIVKPMWNDFFGKTIKEVYSKLQFAKAENSPLLHLSAEHTKKLVSSEMLSSYKYNMLYKGNGKYHFFNHVMKPTQGKALVHVSPLIGFFETKTAQPVASDLLSEQDYIDVNQLKQEQVNRVFNACNWSGDNVVNTFTMRKPISNYKEFMKDSVVYRMEKAHFSSSNIVDKLPLNVILYLTPEASKVPENKRDQFHSDVSNNLIRIQATESSLARLIPYYKELFKSELIDGKDLVLQRELAKKI